MNKLTERQKQALQTKHNIIHVAIDMLKKEPYENVKITEICLNANISIGTFYHYFKSKDLLITEIYNSIYATIMNNYLENTYLTDIEAIINLNISAANQIDRLGYMFLTSVYRLLLNGEDEFIVSSEKKFYAELLILVQKAIENNEIGGITAEKLADSLSKIARGVIFDWCIKHGSYDIIETWKEDITNIISLYKIHY